MRGANRLAMDYRIPQFDAHFHIIEPGFSLVPNQGCLPEHDTSNDYQQQMTPLDTVGSAVVSASCQAYDHAYLIHALTILGPSYVGVMQLHPHTSDATLMPLNLLSVRAIRFNLKRSSDIPFDQFMRLATRVDE